MGTLLENLKKYFENTSQEVLDEEWDRIKYLNEIGPDVIEYADCVKKYFNGSLSQFNLKEESETHRFEVDDCAGNSDIPSDALFCLAA